MAECKVVITKKPVRTYRGSLLVFIVSGDGKKVPRCDRQIRDLVGGLFELGDFKGKEEETMMLYPDRSPLGERLSAKRVLLVGVGALRSEDDAEVMELMRLAGGSISKAAGGVRAKDVNIVVPTTLKRRLETTIGPLVEGLLLGNYRFEKYKKSDPEAGPYSGVAKIELSCGEKTGPLRRRVKTARLNAAATIAARDMANEPGNKWTAAQFAAFARRLAGESDLSCTVLGKERLKKAGMGGIIGVNQGSATPPKLVILEHRPKRYTKTILLVGKGVTFDSGGVSLKPAAGMQDMKYDMCGGAAVMAAMQAVAAEKPAVRVVAIVPATDNMAGGSAIKPGDLVEHYNGLTSEVVNTDAEGRLILADALAYGIETYKPTCVIDLATLTGAVIVGLGHHRSGLMSNSDSLVELVCAAGRRAGERHWRLPLEKEDEKQIESDVADVKNIGGKAGGAITAGAYLKKFVGETPWVHLDIAGTAWDYTKKSYVPKGASGFGVRTLLEFVRNWKELQH